jgi:hypothetical protein
MTAPKKEPVVVSNTTKRDALVAMIVGIVILIFVGYGISHMSKPVAGNKLTGTIVKKTFTPLKEQQINFSGRKLEGTKESAGEFVLQVRVEAENRTYDVPVEQPVYESKKVGDSLTFIRPASEQR